MYRFRFIIVCIIGFAGIAGSLFVVENEVQSLREDLAEINRQIHSDKEAMHVMQAEWAYLNQPERIEALTKEHLPQMAVQSSTQYYSTEAALHLLDTRGKQNAAALALAATPNKATP